MKKYLMLGFIALLISIGLVIAAKPDFLAATVTNPVTGEPKNTVIIPAKAVEVAPNIFYLGTALDNGRVVEGYAFIDYKKGFGKPGTECGNGICEKGENAKKCPADCANGGEDPTEPDTSSCYRFLSKGAKWKTVEDYLVDPANTRGLDESFVANNLALDIAKWEAAASFDILGNEIAGIVDGADTVSPDDKNEVFFADIDSPGAIGVTIVWGIFRGPPSARELVEWDMIYDDVDFDWSAAGEAGKMDFENIATHELGHAVGLGHPSDTCTEETMYRFAVKGETKKQTLEDGDIAGITKLYG